MSLGGNEEGIRAASASNDFVLPLVASAVVGDDGRELRPALSMEARFLLNVGRIGRAMASPFL